MLLSCGKAQVRHRLVEGGRAQAVSAEIFIILEREIISTVDALVRLH